MRQYCVYLLITLALYLLPSSLNAQQTCPDGDQSCAAAADDNDDLRSPLDRDPTQGAKMTSDGLRVDAKGGTELMSDHLMSRLPSIFHDRFHIVKSRIRELSITKKNILWIHDLPGDPESKHFSDPNSHKRFAAIVFVSEWQRSRFEQHYRTSWENSYVLRNAIDPIEKTPKAKHGQLRIIYHTTPHRGLGLLMNVFTELYKKYNTFIQLEVYSSFEIYHKEQAPAFDAAFQQVFDMCRNHPGCNYHGTKPNDEVRQALQQTHIFAYPSVFHETSCISIIEALSAGAEVVASDYGAISETLGETGVLHSHHEDVRTHMLEHIRNLDKVIRTFWEPENESQRENYRTYVDKHFRWGFYGDGTGRIEEWTQMLMSLDAEFFDSTDFDSNSFESEEKYVQFLIAAGRKAEHDGKPEKAAECFETALKREPNNSHALLSFGRFLLTTTKSSNEKGIELLKRALASGTPSIPKDSVTYLDTMSMIAGNMDRLIGVKVKWSKQQRKKGRTQRQLGAQISGVSSAPRDSPTPLTDPFKHF